MTFANTGLDPELLRAVDAAGYKTPTPIQEKVIPLALEGTDIIGIAQTGTGKTASFALPALHRLIHGRARARMPRVLILEPTRELAAQVVDNLEAYGARHNFKSALLIGGMPFGAQDAALERGADIIIATPGRLLDHFERGKLLLGGVEFFVIDEADRMLDMGFIPDIQRIERLLRRRQTLLFSATMPQEIEALAGQFLNAPRRVEATPPATAATSVVQKLVWTNGGGKARHLAQILRSQPGHRAIIFCNRKRETERVRRVLEMAGLTRIGALHGDLDQHRRMQILEGFRDKSILYLVASDVAARGLDIPQVAQVVNYDVPTHAEDYIHRIGRTGRAGAEGMAWTLASADEEGSVAAIETLLKAPIALAAESGERPPPIEEQKVLRRDARPASRNNGRGRKPVRGANAKRRNGNGKQPSSFAQGAPIPAFLQK